MDNAFRVRRLQAVGNLNRQLHHVIRFQRLALDAVFEGLALQVLHDDEGLAFMLVNVVNGADVGMIERRGRAGFALEAFQRLAVLGKMLRQKLQGDEAAEFNVLGLVHHSHTPVTQHLQHPVVRNLLAHQVGYL